MGRLPSTEIKEGLNNSSIQTKKVVGDPHFLKCVNNKESEKNGGIDIWITPIHLLKTCLKKKKYN